MIPMTGAVKRAALNRVRVERKVSRHFQRAPWCYLFEHCLAFYFQQKVWMR